MPTNTPYARGDRAWGMCARSNIKMLVKDMVRDGLTGLPVHPDWYEPPLPAPPADIYDGVMLPDPAPDLDQIGTFIVVGNIYDISEGNTVRPLFIKVSCGKPSIHATANYLATEDGVFIVDEYGNYIALTEYLATEDGEFLLTEDGLAIQL